MDALPADPPAPVATVPGATTTRRPAGFVVVEVRGEVDGSIRTLLRRAMQPPVQRVLIDLTGVNNVSSAGITALMDLRRHCMNIDVRLSLLVSPQLRRPLELVGLGGMFAPG